LVLYGLVLREEATMRRIVMFNRVSADGYFAAADGNIDWVVQDEALDQEAASASATPGDGTILFGRRTYELFEDFWPQFDANGSDPVPNPHVPDEVSGELRAIAEFINDATKVVFSTTRDEVTWRNTRLLRAFDPDEVEALKREPGKDILIFGSGSIVSQLTEHGLIDEYQFVVNPTLIGGGKPLISDVSKSVRLKLLEAKGYPTGNVKLRYQRQ
jgi:dihydrofolate reductase